MLPTRVRRSQSDVLASPFDVFENELRGMMNRWWSDSDRGTTGVYPVNIFEDENHLYVEAELPGFGREEVSVTLENGVLSIEAQRKSEPGKGKGQAHLIERRFTRVARSFSLPNTVDEGKVEARLEAGVLHLTLNKREEVKPRKIEVK